MTEADRAALELAMEYARRDPERALQLDKKLKGERGILPQSWQAVAEFAAYCAQTVSLHLKPWEAPPCLSDGEGNAPEDKLCRKMLEAGISRFHPDPMAALAQPPSNGRERRNH